MSLKNLICVACLTLWFGPAVQGKQPEVRVTGVFSNLKYNQEGGDLLGIEVFISYGGGGEYWLLFQESNGEPNSKGERKRGGDPIHDIRIHGIRG